MKLKGFPGRRFSYVYTRAFLDLAPFPNLTFAEDYAFVCDGAARGADCLAFHDDCHDPIVLHVLHALSSTWTAATKVVATGAAVVAPDAVERLTGCRPPESRWDRSVSAPPIGIGHGPLIANLLSPARSLAIASSN